MAVEQQLQADAQHLVRVACAHVDRRGGSHGDGVVGGGRADGDPGRGARVPSQAPQLVDHGGGEPVVADDGHGPRGVVAGLQQLGGRPLLDAEEVEGVAVAGVLRGEPVGAQRRHEARVVGAGVDGHGRPGPPPAVGRAAPALQRERDPGVHRARVGQGEHPGGVGHPRRIERGPVHGVTGDDAETVPTRDGRGDVGADQHDGLPPRPALGEPLGQHERRRTGADDDRVPARPPQPPGVVAGAEHGRHGLEHREHGRERRQEERDEQRRVVRRLRDGRRARRERLRRVVGTLERARVGVVERRL